MKDVKRGRSKLQSKLDDNDKDGTDVSDFQNGIKTKIDPYAKFKYNQMKNEGRFSFIIFKVNTEKNIIEIEKCGKKN